ncbi:hypothetical protein G6F56_007906 [Rhizopus delemar]|nr:hypothetical protein G6F56_007906 [Rhizopus delemar]
MRAFYESKEFDEIKPIKDFSLEALKIFKKRGFQLVIITSRQQLVAEKTKKFIDRHYPGIFESMYFCNLNLSRKEQLEYISKPKSVICQEIGVDVLIDDSLEHALDCSRVEVLLYDRLGKYTWNHSSQLPSNVHRVFNWKQVMARFPKPTSPLKQCIYSSDDGDYFHNYQYHLPSYCEYETIEVEEESSDDEIEFFYPNDNTVCV